MSLEIDGKNNQFAFVVNEQGKQVGSVSHIDSDKGLDNIELKDGYKFGLAPRPTKEKERMTLFIAGESGAGKSTYVCDFARRYKKMFPKNQIYLISYLDKDTTLDSYKEIIRLDAMQPDFLDQCMEMDLEAEFNNSMVIFDDCDSITSKKMKEKIFGLLNKMLRIGRHYNITVAYVGHELYHSHELKCILNESMTITFFPRFLNFKKMKYLLETYLGLSKEQIDKIRAIRDRSVTFIKGSDKIILSDTQCFIL